MKAISTRSRPEITASITCGSGSFAAAASTRRYSSPPISPPSRRPATSPSSAMRSDRNEAGDHRLDHVRLGIVRRRGEHAQVLVAADLAAFEEAGDVAEQRDALR